MFAIPQAGGSGISNLPNPNLRQICGNVQYSTANTMSHSILVTRLNETLTETLLLDCLTILLGHQTSFGSVSFAVTASVQPELFMRHHRGDEGSLQHLAFESKLELSHSKHRPWRHRPRGRHRSRRSHMLFRASLPYGNTSDSMITLGFRLPSHSLSRARYPSGHPIRITVNFTLDPPDCLFRRTVEGVPMPLRRQGSDWPQAVSCFRVRLRGDAPRAPRNVAITALAAHAAYVDDSPKRVIEMLHVRRVLGSCPLRVDQPVPWPAPTHASSWSPATAVPIVGAHEERWEAEVNSGDYEAEFVIYANVVGSVLFNVSGQIETISTGLTPQTQLRHWQSTDQATMRGLNCWSMIQRSVLLIVVVTLVWCCTCMLFELKAQAPAPAPAAINRTAPKGLGVRFQTTVPVFGTASTLMLSGQPFMTQNQAELSCLEQGTYGMIEPA